MNVSKTLLLIIYIVCFLFGFVCARNFYSADGTDRHYRAVVDQQQKRYNELAIRNTELEADINATRRLIDDANSNMERTIGNIADDNTDALAAVRELRKIHKQIQSRVLDSGSDSGGAGGGGDN